MIMQQLLDEGVTPASLVIVVVAEQSQSPKVRSAKNEKLLSTAPDTHRQRSNVNTYLISRDFL